MALQSSHRTGTSTTAYKTLYPSCSAAEASRHAKKSEEAARNNASSLRDYNKLCGNAVKELLNSASNVPPKQDERNSNEVLPSAPSEGPAGLQVGRYTNARHFKDGIFSEVFKAELPDPLRKEGEPAVVALKITTPSMMTAPHDAVREARILAAAQHTHVIPLLETFKQSGGRFVLAFPFMQYDLNTLLLRKQVNPASQKTILKDLFSALAHLHSLGIIHRDVKPSNILLPGPTGPACLADFGIAWSPSDPASEPADEKIMDVGTTSYRPPELLFGDQAYGITLDMWAAGCVVAQVVCLDGKTLFDAGDLGSELALIKSIFETLGTPDLRVWPEAATLPDWGKMNFRQYPKKQWDEILPGAPDAAADLVSKLVVFESSKRFSALEALEHPALH